MSFGGFTNFAKSALLTAQKHIDSALHIEEEEEDVEEEKTQDEGETEREEDEDVERSIYKSAIQDNEKFEEIIKEAKKEGNDPEQPSDFLDVDLNVPSLSSESHWEVADPNVEMAVVDTEPNPIRDSHVEPPDHHFHYSPPSSVKDHSPDEEDGSQNGQSTSTAPTSSALDLSLINLDKDQDLDETGSRRSRSTERGPSSVKTLDKFEDVRTVASSDIEVIRQMDDWSVTSNHSVQPPKVQTSLKELQQSQSAELLAKLGTVQSQQDMGEQIALLNAKIKHRDQRIEELGRLNDNLKATNANLATKNKQKTAAETKLQNQFSEKEKQLNDLLEEGKKLSEYSGRQANEIRKLKQQLTQLDVVTAARDNAIEELQEAHHQLQEQENLIDQLKEEQKKSDRRAEQLQTELDNITSHADNLEQQLCQQVTKAEGTSAELKRVEKALQVASKERDELDQENKKLSIKLMNRKAQQRMEDERDRGMEEDLKAERAKNATANARIRELEQRVETLQDAQRDIAVEISNANSPLLNTISTLEEKVFTFEREKEGLARSLRQSAEQLKEQKRRQEAEMEAMARNLEEEQQNSGQKTEELAKAFSERAELQSQLKRLEKEWDQAQKGNATRVNRLEQRVEQLEAEISTKRDELTELQRKNSELQQKLITSAMEKRNNPLGAGPLSNGQHQQQKNILDQERENEVTAKRKEWTVEQQREWQERNRMTRPERGGTVARGSPSPRQSTPTGLPGEHSPNYSLDVSAADHLRAELDTAHAQLYQLHERFENLLEMYGGCLETIEEMKEDNEDLRKLCKEQALRLVEVQQSGMAEEEMGQ